MSSFLIDTHILLWLIFDPDKIPSEKLSVLEDSKNKIFVSSTSFWEISLKYSLGKLELSGLKPEWLPAIAKEMGLEIVTIASDTMSTIHNLSKTSDHKDPFDKIIIWHCIKNGITLISQDRKFMQYREFGLSLV